MNERQSGSMGDELTNAALIALISVFALGLVLRGAGSVAAFLTGTAQPTSGPAGGLGVLFSPGDPGTALGAEGLNPVVYWIVTTLLLALVTVGLGWCWMKWRRHSHKVETDPRHLAGVATTHEVTQAASPKALLRRAASLRPSLDAPSPEDVGYLLGTSRGKQVWASVEDSILLIGPPRSGKGLHVVINAVLDAPGAVVTTSTRPDNLTATLRARRRDGRPVAVFDPQHLAEGLPAGLRWSPVRGCEDPLTAMIRATGLASATGLSAGGVESGGFWEGKTRTALQALLHAAALDHRQPAELFRWTLDPSAAADAAAILTNHPNAAAGWADSLGAMIDSDPRTRDSIWQGVALALGALADPRVLDAVSPAEGESFDPEAFIRNRGTLYLLATGAGAGASAALVAAFVEDLVETARRIAARSPGARLDPPLLLALDEIGNLAPLPSLPTLMAEGGGTGITTMPVLQSLAQARDKWSENQAGAIWDASIVKIILGGASNSKDLQDLSTLIGERDEYTDSVTLGDHGTRSNQRSVRRVPILPPDRIRTLPFGTGVTLLRAAPPIVTDLRAWPNRSDAGQLKTDRTELEALLQRPADS
ncbi:type IV secretory system conjugative DNA transfer family protein [Tessaracoccus sp. Y36]|uniref:Type IV secretory system Conjugative DNA transfer n=2 Tax=Actinomycetes TaxID=1760 RepID=A0A0F0LVT7_9MICO|nr:MULTISPECIES: type IV secretory system conjugative DNA transfer family protein [unclassified Rhodococcus (in: high G+C Gram-positive bacteria)]KJL36415.1 Type IV secretory system Conjugative DNA transfer [Microbacterium ginsengisoli]MDI9960457.1 TraM recognition domain-containing protein [Rhodococcus sp. IEGM 1237]MDI9966291.1 TraM recognition domain-containing protein [Rhodococcus sp. IEGM 1251]MDV8128627.1 TraM recognition domain-containing protein [Rhodococcus sp. IEGM 1304]